MAFGTITSTSNTFGSVDGTATGSVPGTLSGSVGVPGPAGEPGAPGVGVPVGGTTGQALVKTSNSDYATGWTTLNLTQYLEKANNLSDLANVGTARTNLGLGVGNTVTFAGLEGTSVNDAFLISPTGMGISSVVPDIFDPNIPQSVASASLSTVGNGIDIYNRTWATVEDWPSTTSTEQRLRYDYTDGFGTLTLRSKASIESTPVELSIKPTGITFPNASVQTTAFPGFNNAALTGNPTAPTPATSDNDTSIATTAFVKAQGYAPLSSPVFTGNPTAPTPATSDNDTSIATTAYVKAQAFGDRYLTSSTTSLTVSNGNKTLTVGTGLSYTPTQNVTISFDASNHMHGEVLTYNSGTGVMTVDVNHHTGSGTYTSWVVNVGGVTPATSVAWGAITGTLSAQTDLNTALGLKANLASPTFTGTPSLPTGTIGVTQTAGDNTTALATTAFVTASNPDASTTVKGHVELATELEAFDGTSATTAINPFTAVISQMSPSAFVAGVATGLSGAQTAGSSTMFFNGGFIDANGTGVGYVSRSGGSSVRGGNTATGINWAKPVAISGRINAQTNFQTQCVFRMNIGASVSTLGTPSVRSIGVFFGASATNTLSALVLEVHDGTSLSSVTTSFTPTFGQMFDVLVYSDGTGNAYCYVNGSLVGSSSAAPSTAATGGQNLFVIGLQNVTTPTAASRAYFYNLKWMIN